MTRNSVVAKASVIATAVVTGVVVFAGAAMAAGGDGGPIGPGPRGFGGRGDHHRGWGGILVLVGAVLLAVLITWLIARRNSHSSASRPATPETILSERLARSEISVDDYRTTLAALREASSR